jgi:hypothetical protein
VVSERECARAWAAPFPIPFSRFNSLTKTNAKTRRDESNKTQKTKTKEERKKNRERKKERSLSLSVWVVIYEEYIPDSGSSPLENASFFLSFSQEKNDEKFWREFFFFFLLLLKTLSLFFVVLFFKRKFFALCDFFFSLFLQPFWENDTTLDSLLTVKKRVRERDSEREREDHRSLAALKDQAECDISGAPLLPARFRDQFLFQQQRFLDLVVVVNFSTQLLLN